MHYHGGADWDPDFATAREYFVRAASKGGSVAQGYLGQMYLNAEGVEQDNESAYKHFKVSAEGGSAMGLNGMGLCFWKGIIVMQDYDEALNFFSKAAAKDHVEAMYNAAMMLQERDEVFYADSIVENLMTAVRNGHLASHFELAKAYGKQPGFCSLAMYLLKSFVEKADSFLLLDQAHEHFKQGRSNQAISRYLYMAAQGFEVAQSNLAHILKLRMLHNL